jgi:hypothetical protein
LTGSIGQPPGKSQRARSTLAHVLLFAGVGPAVGWMLMMTVLIPSERADGWASADFAFLVLVAAYVVGLLPATATGIASLAFRHWHKALYMIATTLAGAVLAGLMAFAVGLLKPFEVGPNARSVLSFMVIGAPAACVCALLSLRASNLGKDPAAVFD